jgi:copper chaperone
MTKSAVLKVLDGLGGVERAEADRATGDVEVVYYEVEVSAEKFREAIEDAGYALVGAEKG